MINTSKEIKYLFFTCLLLSLSITTQAAQYIQFTEKNIEYVKKSINNNTAHHLTQKAYNVLIKSADNALSMKPPTVIDKTFMPPSQNKHDYMSISRYWWPDPKSPDGLPWIRKDGITNPNTQTNDVDRKRLGKVTSEIKTLSLAYFFSNNEIYAKKSVELITTWFLDEATKMNPHFKYSQSVPGNPKGRRSGILDGRLIPERVLDSLTLLSTSKHWTQQKSEKMNHWLTGYLTWLTQSKLGKAGAKQTNNHGSWYRFQVASLAWYLNNDELLARAINDTKQSFDDQFSDNGAQNHELQRTRGFFYSCFNLIALSRIASISEKYNLSLWDYKSKNGRTLKLAIDYLMPVTRGETWPHSSKTLDISYIAPLLGEIMKYQPEKQYEQTLIDLLKTFENKKEIQRHQQTTLLDFALLNPKYLQ